jgi:hypothetical protein
MYSTGPVRSQKRRRKKDIHSPVHGTSSAIGNAAVLMTELFIPRSGNRNKGEGGRRRRKKCRSMGVSECRNEREAKGKAARARDRGPQTIDYRREDGRVPSMERSPLSVNSTTEQHNNLATNTDDSLILPYRDISMAGSPGLFSIFISYWIRVLISGCGIPRRIDVRLT